MHTSVLRQRPLPAHRADQQKHNKLSDWTESSHEGRKLVVASLNMGGANVPQGRKGHPGTGPQMCKGDPGRHTFKNEVLWSERKRVRCSRGRSPTLKTRPSYWNMRALLHQEVSATLSAPES